MPCQLNVSRRIVLAPKALINLISDYERNIFHVKKAQADGIMVETNERNYTFKSRQYLQNALDKIEALYGSTPDEAKTDEKELKDNFSKKPSNIATFDEVAHSRPLKVVNFEDKKIRKPL